MRWCPQCDKSFPESTSKCTDDGSELIDDAAHTARSKDDAALEIAGTADSHFQADMLAALLEDEGIDVHVADHDRQHTTADFDPVDSWEILVHPSDLSRARDLIEKRKATLDSETDEGAAAAEAEERTTEGK